MSFLRKSQVILVESQIPEKALPPSFCEKIIDKNLERLIRTKLNYHWVKFGNNYKFWEVSSETRFDNRQKRMEFE